MMHRGQEKARVTSVHRWKAERGGIFRGRGPSVVGRSFREDLALFERQVRGEAEERAYRPTGPVSPEALSA